ncbi:acyltransferase [Alistipes putredinis]|uniref:acyltransferase family protein n=1 Tax=Alistipes putredinis TaxID=28117 RepID=UPI00374DB24A|nr:acyltransferase [Alistipes putredinis]
MKTSSKPRDLSFDIARVICTLWIVGIWHLMNYIPNQAPAALTTGIGEPVTVTVLSCFMFISGYFLRKYPFNNRADVLIFYRKRFSRFYVLYFLSAVTLLIGGFFTAKSWFSSYPQFILTLCGLTTFSPPQPGTLWFMSMLMFFYVVTPFIQYGKNPKTTILHAAVLLLLMLLWGQVATIDRSVFLYYLMYVLGLHCTPRLIKRFNGHICVLLISLTIWICLTELIPSGWGGAQFSVKITYSVVGIIFLLCLSTQLAKITRLHKIIQILAYLSLALYLFHRQIYQFVMVIYSCFYLQVTIYTAYLLMFPLAILSTYVIQFLYDSAVSKFKTV